MPVSNPIARPGIVLAGNRNMEEFSKFVDTAGAIVDAEKKRRAEEQANLDKNFKLPEYDTSGIFQKELEEVNAGIKDVEVTGVDFYGQGIDYTLPKNAEAFKTMNDKQRSAFNNIAVSNQHKKIFDNAVAYVANPSNDDKYDKEETMARMALYTDPNLSIAEREALLDQYGGVLIAEKAFNPIEFEREIVKKYGPASGLGDFKEGETDIKGFRKIGETKGFTPQLYSNMAAEMLQDDRYRQARKEEFDGLSEAKQQEILAKAAEGMTEEEAALGIDEDFALQQYVAGDLAEKFNSEDWQMKQEAKGNTTIINQGQTKIPTSPILYRIAAMTTGNSEYVQEVTAKVDGKDKQIKIIDFPPIKMGTFKFKDYKRDAEGNIMKDPETGKPIFEIKDRAERIEAVYQIDGQWYVSTNKSKYEKRGIRMAGSYDYGVPISDPKDLLEWIGLSEGEYNNDKLWKMIDDAGALGEGGAIDWYIIDGTAKPKAKVYSEDDDMK